MKGKDLYSLDWFENRAFSSLKKITTGIFDYSDSLLLYVSGLDDEYEKIQHKDNPYCTLVTAPEQEYLQQIAKDVVIRLPKNFEYIDLEPGSEHKEQYLFDEIQKTKKKCVYRPVDISQKFLDMAVAHAKDRGILTKPVRASFEELTTVLQKSNSPRFISLGLTYSNYKPQEVLKLLADIAGNVTDMYLLTLKSVKELTTNN